MSFYEKMFKQDDETSPHSMLKGWFDMSVAQELLEVRGEIKQIHEALGDLRDYAHTLEQLKLQEQLQAEQRRRIAELQAKMEPAPPWEWPYPKPPIGYADRWYGAHKTGLDLLVERKLKELGIDIGQDAQAAIHRRAAELRDEYIKLSDKALRVGLIPQLFMPRNIFGDIVGTSWVVRWGLEKLKDAIASKGKFPSPVPRVRYYSPDHCEGHLVPLARAIDSIGGPVPNRKSANIVGLTRKELEELEEIANVPWLPIKEVQTRYYRLWKRLLPFSFRMMAESGQIRLYRTREGTCICYEELLAALSFDDFMLVLEYVKMDTTARMMEKQQIEQATSQL